MPDDQCMAHKLTAVGIHTIAEQKNAAAAPGDRTRKTTAKATIATLPSAAPAASVQRLSGPGALRDSTRQINEMIRSRLERESLPKFNSKPRSGGVFSLTKRISSELVQKPGETAGFSTLVNFYGQNQTGPAMMQPRLCQLPGLAPYRRQPRGGAE